MSYKFSLQIDDDKHSLTAEHGIPIDKIGQLLSKLYEAIDAEASANCTLSSIRGNCYAMDFTTETQMHFDNFVRVHRNIAQLPYDQLDQEERKYTGALKAILGNSRYVKAYDGQKNLIVSITTLEKKEGPSVYYSHETVYGIVSELGGKKLASSKHIFVDGINFRIYISKDQDLQLKPFYGTQKLRIHIRHKHSSEDGHIINAEMESFEVVNTESISESLQREGYIDFEYIKDAHTIDDIINKLYGGNT